ncbi:TonB-dependent receptor [Flaviaesturariibacter flavus]|uniref:TonB-dependent receptor n=1 Tax=Flaviaesturariibacter flavus TaxID=2502780 RepID=A0A4R1B3S2_9BACT|nr:TonB-dependent receptor [Flaviaesturariibacter flavus]TCJ12521.1 TonB-dependent receptor [Flaviaesturariibacter flavus]
MKAFFTILLCFFSATLLAQRNIRFEVRNARTGEAIAGATVTAGSAAGRATNDSGVVVVNAVTTRQTVTVSAVGFNPASITITGTTGDRVLVNLELSEKEEEAVIVSSTRTESRIENLPTRVEVLGYEEVNEEVGIKPGHIGSLLSDVAGIQAQQASAVSGNTEMRVQGLPGKYTQLLRDGLPLFGAFAGNFSILQIPPLDLKQVEIIKGSSSTLYGGGAIAGMINLISRRPVAGQFEKTLLVNQSTLGESNVNAWLSNRQGKVGYSFFGGITRQQEQDVDGDGYSDVARSRSLNLHPVIFLYPNSRQTLLLGYNAFLEERTGGDLLALRGEPNVTHSFFIRNETYRHSGELQWENRISPQQRLQLKATASWFDRFINNNTFSQPFHAGQLSWYSELSYLHQTTKHDLVGGVNVNGQDYGSVIKPLPAESYSTVGVFLQDDWRLHPKLTLESGLRTDFVNRYGTFVLPRISLLYRLSPVWTARVGGGLGYRIPTVYESDVDEREYILLTNSATKAERSTGGNLDVNFHKRFDEVDLAINQSFFLTSVQNVAELFRGNGTPELLNVPDGQPLETKGSETYVQLRIDEFEAYLGYTYTDATRRYMPLQPRQPLIARDKFAAVTGYEFTSHFRASLEASHIGRQYLEEGRQTPGYFLAAAMIRYDWKAFSFVLNCENLFDYRQSKVESLVAGGRPHDPVFRELWAPIEGRVANVSVRVKL